jgi:cytochrome c oxidase subunit 2
MAEGGAEADVRSRHSFTPMLIFGAVATAIGIWIVLAIHWFPVDASQQAKRIRILYDVLLIASVPIFVLVITVIGFSVYWFRMRPGEEDLDGPPIHGNTRLEVIWTVTPAILIVGLCSYAVAVLAANETNKPNTLTIDVTVRQWAFEYAYPQANGKYVYSPWLYLPNGRPVLLKLRSVDVIHSFFVPEFSQKIDAVPGIVTTLHIDPTRRGTYPVECTELCGAGHSLMRSTTYVLPPSEFARWIAAQPLQAKTSNYLAPGSVLPVRVPGIPGTLPPAIGTVAPPASTTTASTGPSSSSTTPSTSTSTSTSTTSTTSKTPSVASLATGPGTTPAAGKAVFNSAGCSGCHTLAAAGATGTIGPNLDQRLPIDCKTRNLPHKQCVLEAVTTPYAYIPPGYQSGIMPSTFASTLGPTKLAAVVNFVASVTK